MKRTKKEIFAILLIIATTWLVFYRLFYPESSLIVTPDFSRSDSWHLGTPMKYEYWHKLQQNQLPLWSSRIYSGFPILGDGQTGLFFIPNLILFRLFSFTTAFNLSFVFAYVWLGTGMYYWMGTFRFSRQIRIYGAITLMFSGITFARLTHLAVLQAISFIPWVLWTAFLLNSRKNFRAVFIFALVSSQQLLSGFTQAAVITQMFAVGYLIFLNHLVAKRAYVFLIYAAGLVLAMLFSALHILPAQEFIRNSAVPKGFELKDAIRYSYPLKHLQTYIDPFFLGNPRLGTYPKLADFDDSIFWENTGYLGYVPLLGLVLLVWKRKALPPDKKRLVVFGIIGIFISFILMLGKYSPLYLLFSFWPFNQFRVTSRFIWILTVLLILLSAVGLDLFYKSLKRHRTRNLIFFVILILHTFQLIQPWWNYHLLGKADMWLSVPKTVSYFDNTQNLRISSFLIESKYLEAFEKGWVEPQPHEFLRQTLLPNSNLFWDISHTGLIAGRFIRRPAIFDNLVANSLELHNDIASVSGLGEKFLKLTGASLFISAYEMKSDFLTFIVAIQEDQEQFFIYKDTDPVQRVYFAQDISVADTVEKAVKLISEDRFIPGKSVILEESIDTISQVNPPDNLRIISDEDLQIIIHTGLIQQKSLLVLADTYYPGWKAFIDGSETKIYPANLRQRAVIVPSGAHEVIFKYEPESFKHGLVISISSLLLSLIVLMRKSLSGFMHKINRFNSY